MSGRLLALAALAAAVLAAPAAAITPVTPTTSLLFVQDTAGGSLTRVARARDRYRLTLTGVSPSVTTFTDRPRRRAGQLRTRDWVARWSSYGFASDPPNAALAIDGAPRDRDVALLTLSKPRYDARARTLTYDARPLRTGRSAELAPLNRRADPLRTGRFGAASLFVDDAGTASVYQQVTLQVSNVAPGQRVQVDVSPNGAPVTWSTGPGFEEDEGFEVLSQTGPIPLGALSLTAPRLTLVTASSGGGGALAFGVELFLVADSDVETFYLSSGSDPGVQVQAQIGDAQPQAVNQTDTLFAWNPD